MKELINIFYKTIIGNYILCIVKKYWNKYQIFRYKRLNDEELIQIRYKEFLSKKIDLKNPKLFTEKIQWLKLNDRRDIYTKCADKFHVRSYVEEKLGTNYLIPLVFMTEKYRNINQINLPDYPVIIKTTHDSGSNLIINDKKNIDFKKVHKFLARRLKYNHYYLYREWEYKNIKPRIIVEKLFKDEMENQQLNDYKVHCFHGKPQFIQTIFDRGSVTKEDWYDTSWNPIDVYYFSPIKKNVQKPKVINELLRISEILSQDFPYVRVDLYIVENKIYFGELTFRPYGGFMSFVPESFDIQLGNYLNLNNI